VAEIITVTDLPVALRTAELIDIMVAGANAKALRIAPCLASTDPIPTDGQLAEAQLVLIGAVKRWAEAGSGALQQQSAGPFSQVLDTRQRTGYNLWPSEIEQLQSICAPENSGAFSIDTAPTGSAHLPWCSLNFGAVYCSCGVDIAGYPIFELN
jgi:hypothetical protein